MSDIASMQTQIKAQTEGIQYTQGKKENEIKF
jgi:hypothetical protein